jgi:predicted flap endonuclease-1-like 5' DNA nuclease
VYYLEDPTDGASDHQRLLAALEALEARDRVLAERTHRLRSLEDIAARLAEAMARVDAAESRLAALQQARQAELEERDHRIQLLERRLLRAAPPPATPGVPQEEGSRLEPGPAGVLPVLAPSGLQTAGPGPADEETTRARAQGGPESPQEPGAYARWEQWFRARLSDRLASEQGRAAEVIRAQRAALEEKESRIAWLVRRLRALEQPGEEPDDLKEINGIGPAIEALLHSIGVTTFEQIAAFGAHDLERLKVLLGAFPGRVERDRWVEQAASLARHRLEPWLPV